MTNLVDLVRESLAHYARDDEPLRRRADPAPRRRNPWVKCPQCWRRNPTLCEGADEPCGLGIRCGCCTCPEESER
jgi:hypothetical protein